MLNPPPVSKILRLGLVTWATADSTRDATCAGRASVMGSRPARFSLVSGGFHEVPGAPHRQWTSVPGRRRTATAPRPLSSQRGPDWHEDRLRHQPVRRVHGALDGVAVKSCTTLDRAGRRGAASRPSRGWPTRPADRAAGSLLGEARAAVWLLHAGHGVRGARDPAHAIPIRRAEEIRHGLEGNLCRCTGYQNIVRSMQAAARPRRACGWRPAMTHRHASPRASLDPAFAGARIRGCSPATARYTADFSLPGMVYAAVLRSPHGHAQDSQHRHEPRAASTGRGRGVHGRRHRRGTAADSLRVAAPERRAEDRPVSRDGDRRGPLRRRCGGRGRRETPSIRPTTRSI